MHPLLLLALVGGGAAVAYKLAKPSCPKEPPPNPFCPPGGAGIDWDALQKSLGVHKNIDKNTDKWLADAQAYGKLVPVYGWYVSAAASAIRAFSSWIATDANSDEYKARATKAAQAVVDLGFIPVTPYDGATLLDLANQLSETWLAIISAPTFVEPYVATLIGMAGPIFKTWGGSPGVLPYAMQAVSSHRGTAPDFGRHYLQNLDLLKPVAAAIAYQYGVCDHVAEVVAASQWGVENFEKAFPWKTLDKGSGTCEPADDPACQSPDLWAQSFYNDPSKMPPAELADALRWKRELADKIPGSIPGGGAGHGLSPRGPKAQYAHFLKGPSFVVAGGESADYAPSAGYYAYAAGMLAALTTAARLAGKPAPPAFTWWSVQDPMGGKQAPPPSQVKAPTAGEIKNRPNVKALIGH